MRVHVRDLQQGDLLKDDTFNKYGVPLLKRGAEINSDGLSLLLQHGIDYVEIEEEDIKEAKEMTAEPTYDVLGGDLNGALTKNANDAEIKNANNVTNSNSNVASIGDSNNATIKKAQDLSLGNANSILNTNSISPKISENESTGDSFDASAEKLKKNIDSTVASYQSLFLDVITKKTISNERIDNSLSELLDSLEEQKDVVSLLLMLEREHTNTYAHSLKVGVLSYYIAKWLGYSEEEVYKITKAGYLHDIGISRISPSLRNLSLDLTEAEQDAFKRHTAYGYQIIINSIQDETSALVAFQHHERGDGSGYPKALTKDEIHPYAQIVAVADVFVEMGLTGPGQIKEGFLTVMRKVHEMSFGKLSEKPVQVMMQHLLPHLIGKQVSLSNGELAVIVLNNPLDFFRPLVKVGEQFRDLSKEQQISMVDIVEAV